MSNNWLREILKMLTTGFYDTMPLNLSRPLPSSHLDCFGAGPTKVRRAAKQTYTEQATPPCSKCALLLSAYCGSVRR